ncbi:Hypothetical protein, predicted heat shock protein chaperone [Mycoplasma yeatsii 13926]|uniref:J domain-containing protein n=1 Tax=Mycoplasma yeatsii 13926 TaxID=1188240 RepID=S6G3C8_9MOLU|nr:Hypothetical protein, predicted heat shock protein chaperone [Mycoplasma yeatsii 13926]
MMIVFLISLLVIWILFFIFVVVFRYLLNRKDQKLKESNSEIDKIFIQNRKSWIIDNKTVILIKEYDYYENFNRIPFFGEYKETKKFLENTKVRFTSTEKLISNLKSSEDQLLLNFLHCEKLLLLAFDELKLEYNKESVLFLSKYYKQYWTIFRELMVNDFVENILKNEISCAIKNISCDVEDEIKKINDTLLQQTLNLIKELKIDIYQANLTIKKRSKKKVFSKKFNIVNQSYALLEISTLSKTKEVKKAYKSILKRYNPNFKQEYVYNKTEINKVYDFIKRLKSIRN